MRNYYKIKSILHSGVDGERNTPRTDGRYPQRIGRIVEIDDDNIFIGVPFQLNYVKDENGNDYRGFVKRTSCVIDWDYIYDNRIRIETYRTIYEFEKVELESNKMKLYFKNPREKRFLGEFETLKEIDEFIDQFLEERNFKSYYTRVNEIDENSIELDVGSWSEFFIIEGISFLEYVERVNCEV